MDGGTLTLWPSEYSQIKWFPASFTFLGMQIYFERCFWGLNFPFRRVFLRTRSGGQFWDSPSSGNIRKSVFLFIHIGSMKINSELSINTWLYNNAIYFWIREKSDPWQAIYHLLITILMNPECYLHNRGQVRN